MAERNQIYKCDPCGNIVEVLHGGIGTLVCCNKNMRLLKENDTDAALEKHVPVIEYVSDGIKISVGSVPHPMQEEHYIEQIEILADGKVYRQYLNPGDQPEAFFKITTQNSIVAREYCNLHGLWKKEN